MAQTNDTIDGLLAEFRGYSAGMPPSYHVTMSWADFRVMLDRFDAAHKREASGNTEALHEALKPVKRYLDGYTVNILELRRMVDAALTAPTRNCDRFATAEEAAKAWNERKFKDLCVVCAGCTFDRGPEECAPGANCEIGWLYAEAQEGGAK